MIKAETAEQKSISTFLNRNRQRFSISTYLLPAIVIMGLITFYPLLYQVWMSFTNYGIQNIRSDAPLPDLVGIQNYMDIFGGGLANTIPNFDFWYLLGFNLWWAISNTIIHVSLGVLIAVLLNQKGLLFKGVYRAIYVIPIILPSLVIATVWRNLYDPQFGAINLALARVGGIFGLPPGMFEIRWMEQIQPPIPFIPLPLSYFALLITNIWLGWPFQAIVATGALQSINPDFYEAASIDGANSFQRFFRITVPLLRPAMAPAAMYGLITTFNLFNLIYFTSGGGPLRRTEIMVSTAFRLVNSNQLYGMAAAFSVLIFWVLLGLTIVTNSVTRATESFDV